MAEDSEKTLKSNTLFPSGRGKSDRKQRANSKKYTDRGQAANNEMIEILNYMKSDMESSKKEQNAVQDCWF